jgi:hypothetical protein
VHCSAHGIVCAGVLLLGLTGATEVEAFYIRIPSFTMPRVAVPVPRVVPHISVPAVRMAPHTMVRIPHNSSLRMPHTQWRGASRMTRLPPHTPRINRGVSLARRVPSPTKQHTPEIPRKETSSAQNSHRQSAGRSAACSGGGWVDCSASGGVWGYNGSCGSPTPSSCSPGMLFAVQLPSPPDPDSGDWADEQIPPTDSQPPYDSVAANNPPSPPPASQPDINVAANGPPSPPPSPPDMQNGNDGNCTGPAAGTAFFGIPGSPDHPPLDCSSASMPPAPPTSSMPPEPPPPWATYCKDLNRQIAEWEGVAARGSLAQDVYNFYGDNLTHGWLAPNWKAPPGFTLISNNISELRALFPDLKDQDIKDFLAPDDSTKDPNSYRAAIYREEKKDKKDKTGKIFVVFRGSLMPYEGEDWAHMNFENGILGWKTSYVRRTEALADALKPYADAKRLEIIGHSLGGALAIVAALRAGAPATVFNAENVHPDMLRFDDVDAAPASDLIVDYATPYEPLTTAQHIWWSAPGKHVTLPDWPGSAHLLAIDRHVMHSVRQAIKNQIELLRKSPKDNACDQFKQQLANDPEQQ